MREVGWAEFCNLPEGTIFAARDMKADGVWDEICRRGSVIYTEKTGPGTAIDFFYVPLGVQSANGLQDTSPVCDTIESRWGRFNYEEVFVVYESQDIDTLLSMLGMPPACVVADLMQDSEGITAQVERRRGIGEGVAKEREAVLEIINDRIENAKSYLMSYPMSSRSSPQSSSASAIGSQLPTQPAPERSSSSSSSIGSSSFSESSSSSMSAEVAYSERWGVYKELMLITKLIEGRAK